MKSLLIWMLLLATGVTALRIWRGPSEPARAAWARTFAPCAAAAAVTAIALGLRRRGTRPSSPSAAWLSKRGALISLGAAAAWVVAAVPAPAWSFYLACACSAAAAGLYASHLPPRL